MTLRVFVSSTFLDLEAHRSKVISGLRRLHGVEVLAMEDWTAHPNQPKDLSLERVRESDVLVAVIGHLHGFVPAGDVHSITQSEYEEAMAHDKPVLAFVVGDDFAVAPKLIRDDPNLGLQDRLREKILAAHTADVRWSSPDDLATRVVTAVSDLREAARSSSPEDGEGQEARSEVDPSAEIPDYCKRVARLHEFLPLAGFHTRLRVPIRVKDLYVQLRVAPDLRGLGDAIFADAMDAENKLRGPSEAVELPATEAFVAAEDRGRTGLVLLGDPGSGKTTHLKRVLLWVLERGPESLGLPSAMLPVFLPLRDLDDLAGGLEGFIEAQLDHPHLRMPRGFGRRLLERGNLLFLLDGLDEVADLAERGRVGRWIDAAAAAYAKCRFLVSCRFAGYSEEVRLSERFLEVHLRPLNREQAAEFVRNWYRIVETGLADDPEQAGAVADTRSQRLIDRLAEPDFRARRVFELTRNPLLLANLCLIHRDRGQLPKRRAELYRECVSVLLESWRTGKGLEAPVTAQDGRRVLQPAAYWMHREEGRTRATAKELGPVLEPALQAIRWSGGTASDFLRRVRDESGLLTGWDQERYGFMHLGFQEYLAAREIRRLAYEDRSVLTELARHHGESWWQEVALLLVALEEPSLFEPYLQEVVEQPAFSEAPEALEALLEDAAEVSDRPFVELAEREPGTDEGLWARQLQALRVLEGMGSSRLDEIRARLTEHPSPALGRWLGEQIEMAAQESAITERGGVELVPIPAGSFTMGSPKSEERRFGDEGPQHEVSVPAFEIGRYAVTNEEYGRFLAANGDVGEPKYWGDRSFNQARQPVVGVSWEEVTCFAEWAGCRLPTEAEWEYAARAGTVEPYLSGSTEKDLDRFGWYGANSENRLHPVGEKEPNEWGLYDVLGNVWEWVEDDWHNDYKGAPVDGSSWVEEPRVEARVVRGGSFGNASRYSRVAYRDIVHPENRDRYVGFRVVRSRSGGQE